MMNSNSLTVKWVHNDGGASWFLTNAVMAIPTDHTGVHLPPGTLGFIDRVEFDRGDGTGVRASIDRGTVYILNAAGKTIDTIHLGDVAPTAEAA